MPDLEWPGAVSPIDCPPEHHNLGSDTSRIGSPSDSKYKSLIGQGGNPISRVGSNIVRIGSPSDSGCQKLNDQVGSNIVRIWSPSVQMPEIE
jgi:hypothetical protein